MTRDPSWGWLAYGFGMGLLSWGCHTYEPSTNQNATQNSNRNTNQNQNWGCTSCASDEVCYEDHCVAACETTDSSGTPAQIICGPSPYDALHSCGTCGSSRFCTQHGTECSPLEVSDCGGTTCDGACQRGAYLCDGTWTTASENSKLPYCCSAEGPVAVIFEDGYVACCSSKYPFPSTAFGVHLCVDAPDFCNGANCYKEATDCNGNTESISEPLCCLPDDHPVPVVYPDGQTACCGQENPYPCVRNGMPKCCATPGSCGG